MVDELNITEQKIWKILETVMDPEVPVLSIIDLGIVRDVKIDSSNKIKIIITPTYTGCPAMDVISMNIRMVLLENGFKNFEIKTVLSPAWTTDWMTEQGKQKLKAYGIAPPNPKQQFAQLMCFRKKKPFNARIVILTIHNL